MDLFQELVDAVENAATKPNCWCHAGYASARYHTRACLQLRDALKEIKNHEHPEPSDR